MYQKYQTEALVLGSRELGEADKVLALYTRDFGLVWARTSGVRRECSLMRYALQMGAQAQVGLVRGKTSWRVAGAMALGQLPGDAPGAVIFARISKLVLRLVHGQEENRYLYEAFVQAQRALKGNGERMAAVELVCVARVLYALGYLSAGAAGEALFSSAAYTLAHLEEAHTRRDEILSSINRALSETQL